MEGARELFPAILLLVVGIASLVVMRQLRLSPIVGYLIGGLMIGPHALGWIEESHTTQLLSELGVVFLLFDIGLHFSLRHIWESRRDIFGLGPLQIVFCLAAFTGVALLFGLNFQIALVLGGALALSSTAVVVPTLRDRDQVNCPVGRTATAILILQDVFAIFLLVLAASMMGGEEGTRTSLTVSIVIALGKGAIAFAATIALGRFAIRPLFRLVAQTKNEEIFTAVALLIVLAMAAASGWAGLSLTLGAFLGGMMLADTSFSHLIRTEAKPFRNLLLAFFFIAIGMSLDWRTLLTNGWQILAVVFVLVVVKTLCIAISAKLVGWSVPGALQLSSLLAQGSEFVFVILSMEAIRSGLDKQYLSVVFSAVAITLALTPTVAELGGRLARQIRKRMSVEIPKEESTPLKSLPPVVIFGMRQVGRTVADALNHFGISYDAIERDYDILAAASADGYEVAYGDLSDYRLSETLSMSDRCLIAITDARFDVSQDLTPIVKERFPKLTRLVCVNDEQEGQKYDELGMTSVIDNHSHPGEAMARRVLQSQSIDDAEIDRWIEQRRDAAKPSVV